MSKSAESPIGKGGEWFLKNILSPVSVIATLLVLLGLIGYFLTKAFQNGIPSGVRSFSGVMLPMIFVLCIFLFRRQALQSMSNFNVWGAYAVSAIIGVGVMFMIRLLSKADSQIPVEEVVFSGILSLLVFSTASSYKEDQDRAIFSYYYGILTGFLAFLVFFGLP